MHKEIKEDFATQELLLKIAAEYGRKARDRIIAEYPAGTTLKITTELGEISRGVVTANFGTAIYLSRGIGVGRVDIDEDTVIVITYTEEPGAELVCALPHDDGGKD